MLEDSIETYLREQVEKYGGRCDKCVNLTRRGWPDRTVQWPSLGLDLVELKKPDGVPESHQTRIHEFLATCGTPVYLIDTKDKVDHYIISRTHGRHARSLFSVPVAV